MKNRYGRIIAGLLLSLFLAAFVVLATLSPKAEAMSGGSNPNWIVLRAVSATDDTGYAADAVAWDTVRSNFTNIQPNAGRSSSVGVVQFRFKGTDLEDETFTWSLNSLKYGSVPRTAAYGTGILGSTTDGTYFYADTIVITAQGWDRTFSVTTALQNNLGTGVVSGGGISILEGDSLEHELWEMKMETSTAATIGCDGTNNE